MSKSVDLLGWIRMLWGCVNVQGFPWEDPLTSFKLLSPAIIVTDCKSLYDLVTRTAVPSCEEFRTTLEVLLIRQRCTEHVIFRWVPTAIMLADSLTKAMNAAFFCWANSNFTMETVRWRKVHIGSRHWNGSVPMWLQALIRVQTWINGDETCKVTGV